MALSLPVGADTSNGPGVQATPTSGAEQSQDSAPVRGRHAAPRSARSSAGRSSGVYALAIVSGVLIVVGVLLRVWLLGNAPMNSDEATAGLVAHQIAHGHTYAFYWGQSYGSVEPYVLALNFLLFGQSPFMLNATPAFGPGGLRTRLARRAPALPARAAVVAAVLSFIWSESSLWNSAREYGLHEVTMVLGLVLPLEALRIAQKARDEGTDRLIDWALLGPARRARVLGLPRNCLFRGSGSLHGRVVPPASIAPGGGHEGRARHRHGLHRHAPVDLGHGDPDRERHPSAACDIPLTTGDVLQPCVAHDPRAASRGGRPLGGRPRLGRDRLRAPPRVRS